MPNTIINQAPQNTASNMVPSFQSIDSGNIVTAGGATQYSQHSVTYSQAGIKYGGLVSSNEGRAPQNKIDNT